MSESADRGDAAEQLYARRQDCLAEIAALSDGNAQSQIGELAAQIEDINRALVRLAKHTGARHWPSEFAQE